MIKNKFLVIIQKILIFSLAIAILPIFSSCRKHDPNFLYVYTWSEYIPYSIYEKFTAETGITVYEDTYATNEEFFTKLMAGGDGYDLVIPSADYYEIMMHEKMVEKLDKSKISTFGNIDPGVLAKLQAFDLHNDYGVPYVAAPTIIAVNTKYVKDYPRDFSIYEMEKYKGKMVLLDDMREVFSSALAMDGNMQNCDDIGELVKASERIKKWKKNILKFDSESFGKGFANGEFWVVHGYVENFVNEVEEEQWDDIDIIIPEKGGTMYIDSFIMLKTAPHKDNAYKFMEFIHRPDIYAEIADYLECWSLNIPARELMETEPYYNMADLEKTQMLRDIGKMLEVQNKYWLEIMLTK